MVFSTIIVTVQEVGSACPDDENRIMPQSESNLVEFGISAEDELNEEPDWGLIIGSFDAIMF